MKQSITAIGGRQAALSAKSSPERNESRTERNKTSPEPRAVKRTAQVQLNYDVLKHLIDTPE
jgi:hypothetical protein